MGVDDLSVGQIVVACIAIPLLIGLIANLFWPNVQEHIQKRRMRKG